MQSVLLCGLKKVNLVGFNLLGALSSDLTFCDLFLLAWVMRGWKWSIWLIVPRRKKFTSPTKSTMSSLPLNCVVASFPLAALHSSELPNSTKAYLQMWVLDPFRLLELDIEKVTLT